MDNCFGYDINWLKEFSFEYKQKIGVKFECIMYPDHVNQDSVKYLKMAGCYAINIGIQSWNENIRKEVLSRKVENDSMQKAVDIIKKQKILLMTDSLFDLPGQKEEDIISSAYRYVDIKPKRIYFYMLRYYPNTLITQEAKKRGWLTAERFQQVMDGVNVTSFAIGGDRVNNNTIKFQILFYLIDLLPKKLSRFIIDKKIYRHFPVIFGPAIIVILRNLVSFDMNAKILRKGAIIRYSYFMLQKKF
jgi:radical SAM superfamily enzyme YgiQ (UPF0313 family)